VGKNLASFISYIFHPLLMPTYTFTVLMWLAPSSLMPIGKDLFWHILLVICLTSFLIPLLFISTLRVTSVIPDFYLDDKRQRIIPFLFVGIIYAVSTYMFYSQFSFTKVIYVLYFSTTLLITLLTLITFYWKISVHSAAIAGTFGILYALQIKNPDFNFLYLLSGLLLVTGLVTSSRLKLNAHTISQTLWGSVVGFAICFLLVYFLV